MSNKEREDFRKLQAKWYKKAKESGFEDIETGSAGMQNTPFLKQHSISTVRAYDADTEEWFRRCRIHLENYDWYHRFTDDSGKRRYRKKKKDYFTWKLYTEGLSYRKIIPLFIKKFKKNISVWKVHKEVNRMKFEMRAARLWEDSDKWESENE